QLILQIRHVDLQAFRNLFDRQDEEYLRQHINAADFRTWQKMRIRAALEYVTWASENAALLIAIGEMAKSSSDMTVAAHGKQLANVALSLRLNCILARVKLYVTLVFPFPGFAIEPVFHRYARVH